MSEFVLCQDKSEIQNTEEVTEEILNKSGNIYVYSNPANQHYSDSTIQYSISANIWIQLTGILIQLRCFGFD